MISGNSMRLPVTVSCIEKLNSQLGLLNIAGQNYNLNPLNLYNEIPRSRTLAVSLQLNF